MLIVAMMTAAYLATASTVIVHKESSLSLKI